MEKYKFNKDYETQVRAAAVGGTGTGTKQIKILKDTIVDGEVLSKGLVTIKHDGISLNIDSSYLDLNIPVELKNATSENKGTVAVKKDEPKVKVSAKKETKKVLSTKNVIIGLAVLGGIIYFLKHKNII